MSWHSDQGHLPPADALPTAVLSTESQFASVMEKKHTG